MASINDLATAAMASDTSSTVKRGAFIVLEGLDRSGKTTQVKLLEQRFVEEGKKVRVMRFPGTRLSLSLYFFLLWHIDLMDLFVVLVSWCFASRRE